MPRKLSILLPVVVIAGALCSFLIWRSNRAQSELAREPTDQPHRTDHTELQPGDVGGGLQTTTPKSRTGLSPSSDEGNATGSGFATFSYVSGGPAAGLRLCSAGAPTSFDVGISQGPANWVEHLDERGVLGEAAAQRLGALLCVRLSSCSEMLVRLAPASGLRYVLPNMIEQRIQLPRAVSGVSAKFRIQSQDVSKCGWAVDYKDGETDSQFADRYQISGSSSVLDSLVLCLAVGELDGDTPTISLQVPAGRYSINPITCSVGWWFDDFQADAGTASIEIPLRQVPVTTVFLPRESGGEVKRPVSARVLVATHLPDGAGGSGEVSLPWKLEGDRLLISQTYRAPGDEHYVTYALKIYWSDGTDYTAPPGGWESLLGTVALDK